MTSMPLSVTHPPSLDTTTCIYDGDSWSAYMPKLHAELTYPTPVGHTTFSIYIINLKRPCLTYRLGILMTKARNTFRFDFVWLWPLSRCITSSHKCKKPLRISAKVFRRFSMFYWALASSDGVSCRNPCCNQWWIMENFSVEEPTFLKKPNRKKTWIAGSRVYKKCC